MYNCCFVVSDQCMNINIIIVYDIPDMMVKTMNYFLNCVFYFNYRK